ncbi:MAG: hypothetical protein Q4D55_04525 [Eubacteriales bacterium]|nr:hypothetical protein [Eubacteriales bacterium]
MYQMEGAYQERTAARAAAFLRDLGLGAWTILGRTGVRSDWREQDGPALVVMEKRDPAGDNGHPEAGLHTRNGRNADTYTASSHREGHRYKLPMREKELP